MEKANNIEQTMTGAGLQISGNITGTNHITINNESDVLSILVRRYENIVEGMEREIQGLKKKLSEYEQKKIKK